MDEGRFEGWLPLRGRSGRQQGLGKAQLRVAVAYVPVEQVRPANTFHSWRECASRLSRNGGVRNGCI